MAVSDAAPAVDFNPDLLDISINPDILSDDSAEFLGVVTIDQWEPGKFGPQWHLGVRPVHYQLKGESGAFQTWYSPSTKKNSKMGAAIKAMAGLPSVFTKDTKIGRQQLIGKVCHWVRRDMQFGKDQSGERITAEGVLIPTREATAEEVGEATNALSGIVAVEPASPEYTDEDVEALVALLEGKTSQEAQIAAGRARGLTGELKNAILSGQALSSLLERGVVVVQSDGRIQRSDNGVGSTP